ncbi:MAG: hypothetical protein LBT76_00685 [Tannerella sp.]|nr:hypothetical protein [Tannerella sp.]
MLLCLWLISVFAAAAGEKGGIICLGNGEMAVYEERSSIIQLFGPPYSSPSAFRLTTVHPEGVLSQRETGTAIWTHRLSGEAGTMTDFVAGALPCFVRTVENADTLRFRLKLAEAAAAIDHTPVYRTDGLQCALLITTPAGSFAYNTYPTLTDNHYLFMAKGDLRIARTAPGTWDIVCLPGQSDLRIVSGRDYPQCITHARQALEADRNTLLAQTRAFWQTFTGARTDFEKTLPGNLPQRALLLQTVDDVAVMIKAQQGTEGSVLAGYNYHLGYVRDQYGVSRGLLKLGHTREAKTILRFYWDVWSRKGKIHNAQGIGLDAFHIHENDEVEITGYFIIQAFDYLKKTGDSDFIRMIFPMLEWAWDCQVRNLHRQMLPFNGDETYVAGGILPRTVLFDGSAEATLLFLTGGKRLLEWAESQRLWTAQQAARAGEILHEVRLRYPDRFLKDGKLRTNNPERKQGLAFPPFRHGVCEACIHVKWTQRTANNRYLCAACFPHETLPDLHDETYYVQSVSLTPRYIESDVLPDSQVNQLVQDLIASYTATGKLPSRPDGRRTVGYDYGLFLFSLVRMNHPLKDSIYARMLDVIDDTGAWVEYYEDGVPSGTLCRPWESAINIEAAIEYAENYR